MGQWENKYFVVNDRDYKQVLTMCRNIRELKCQRDCHEIRGQVLDDHRIYAQPDKDNWYDFKIKETGAIMPGLHPGIRDSSRGGGRRQKAWRIKDTQLKNSSQQTKSTKANLLVKKNQH